MVCLQSLTQKGSIPYLFIYQVKCILFLKKYTSLFFFPKNIFQRSKTSRFQFSLFFLKLGFNYLASLYLFLFIPQRKKKSTALRPRSFSSHLPRDLGVHHEYCGLRKPFPLRSDVPSTVPSRLRRRKISTFLSIYESLYKISPSFYLSCIPWWKDRISSGRETL